MSAIRRVARSSNYGMTPSALSRTSNLRSERSVGSSAESRFHGLPISRGDDRVYMLYKCGSHLTPGLAKVSMSGCRFHLAAAAFLQPRE